MFYRREGFGLSLGFDLGKDAFEQFYAWRQRVAVAPQLLAVFGSMCIAFRSRKELLH
jgi:hypothetical protein